MITIIRIGIEAELTPAQIEILRAHLADESLRKTRELVDEATVTLLPVPVTPGHAIVGRVVSQDG